MFQTIQHLRGYKVMAVDGEAGHIDDIYFDDRNWLVQYFVINIGNLVQDKKVLLSPTLIKKFDDEVGILSVKLDINEFKYGLALDSGRLISHREKKEPNSATEAVPISRLGGGLFQEEIIGMSPDSTVEMIKAEETKKEAHSSEVDLIEARKTHLYSTNQLIGSYIHATDGDVGHVEDLIIDEKLWAIQQIVIDTQNWLPGKKVQVEPKWIESIDWSENKVYVSVPKSVIKDKPEFDLTNPVDYPANSLS